MQANSRQRAAAAAQIAEQNLIARIWDQCPGLWRSQDAVESVLGWLGYPDAGRGRLDGLLSLADRSRHRGFKHAVLLGMGGSSLAADVFRSLLGDRASGLQFHVLDSTVPDQVGVLEEKIDLAQTLFVAASKSGTTTEVWALVDHFHRRLHQSGVVDPWSQFAAISDPGSKLAQFAIEHGFSVYLPGDPRVGGRFSAFTAFGLISPALMGADLTSIISAAESARRACGPRTDPAANPAAKLATLLAAGQLAGRDKFTLICSPRLARLGLWIEQLVAESLGKRGIGILPISNEPVQPAGAYRANRVFCQLRLQGDDNVDADRLVQDLHAQGTFVERRDLTDELAIAGEMYVWMMAIALTGCLIRVNPFDQPDVQRAKDTTAALLASLTQGSELPSSGQTSFSDWLGRLDPDGYAAILAYSSESVDTDRALAELAQFLLARGAGAVTSGYGPRYLHSTGQLHKGGPGNGSFLYLLPAPAGREESLPDRRFGLATLARAQAVGDSQTLAGLGRNVACIEFTGELGLTVSTLVENF